MRYETSLFTLEDSFSQVYIHSSAKDYVELYAFEISLLNWTLST